MEQLLHYVWRHRLFPLEPMTTTDGQPLEVIDPGLHNTDAGPDFINAKVRIGGTLWAGNVEIHLRSSDWQRHGHHLDAAYDNVILHVAENVDADVLTSNGKLLPQMQLVVPDSVRHNYAQLSHNDSYPRCWRVVPQLSQLTVHSWLSALLWERLSQRAQLCLNRLRETDGDWERTMFITLARAFGFGKNGDAFEFWARHLALHAAAKHRDNLMQLEALFLGSAGLLAPESLPQHLRAEAQGDAYFLQLQHEWTYLAHKFQLQAVMHSSQWRYLRLRPQNFPHLRIVQLAQLYHSRKAGFAALLKADSRASQHACLVTEPSEYWHTHYLFGAVSPAKRKRLSPASLDLLIINAVVPMRFAHGIAHADEDIQEASIAILEELKPERNYIMRQWQQCGIESESAADSQSLLQLKLNYCDRHDCLRCRFAYEYLKLKS